MPGILATLPSMLLDAESPLHLPLRYLPRAVPWLLRFAMSARPAKVASAAGALAALHADAVARHVALAREIGAPELVLQRGHLHLYPDAQAFARDAAGWQLRRQYGYPFETLDRGGILALEPNIGPRYTFGAFLADHASIVNPFRYVQAIARAFTARGGRIVRCDVQALDEDGVGGWIVRARDAPVESYGSVVVAAGAWSTRLLDPLGVSLHIESQRGYHVQFRGASPVSRTVVLADRKVFMTPMEAGMRVGGTVEIAGLAAPPDPRRAALLERFARETFAGLDAVGATSWMGHRPCMPDSVPVIGPVAGRPGLHVAVGHGHLGLTDAVATAERIEAGLGNPA
jgi:D-amino-acid dehydrogenase